MQRTALRKVANGAVTAVAVAAIVFALSPTLRNELGSVSKPAVRKPAESAALRTLDGQAWSLEQNRGKVVLVNFWATWCPPCRVETPGLVNAYNDLSQRGFTVAGVTVDENPTAVVPSFVSKYGIKYPIVIPTGRFPLADRIEALPTSFLIDRTGKIARVYEGPVRESVLKRDVEQLLSERG